MLCSLKECFYLLLRGSFNLPIIWTTKSIFSSSVLENNNEQEMKSFSDLTPLEKVQLAIECLPTHSEKALSESSKPPLQMGFFIDYNTDDILRHANESTLQYQKGLCFWLG